MMQLLAVAGVVFFTMLAFGSLLAAVRRLSPAEAEPTPMPQRGGGRSPLRAIGALIRPGEGQALEQLRSRTTHAGLYGKEAVDLFLTIRLVLMVLGGVAMVLAVSLSQTPLSALAATLIIAGVTVLGPGAWLDRRARRRQAAIAAGLPDTLDLLALSLEAGLSVEQALRRVAVPFEGGRADLLQHELQLVLADMELGVSVDQAFRRFAARVGSDDVKTVAAVIGRASAFGARIGALLRDHVTAMRQRQLCDLETSSGKASAQLTLPLTICLLPAAMLLLMGPIFYALLTQF